MSDDWIICSRVDTTTVYPGSTIVQCEKCGTDVWVSPASQKMIANGAHVTCAHCAHCALTIVDGNTEFAITPETANEVRAWLRRN